MNRQNESGAMPMALENKISRWNYDKSVEKMRGLGKQWTKVTAEVSRELYLAKEYLTSQKGQRRDPDAPDYIQYSWNDYCEEIGLSRQVADYWIKKLIPREISDTGKDVLLIKAPPKESLATTAERALMMARVNEVLRTGERPTDWSDEEEAEYKRQLKNAELTQLAEKYNVPAISKADDRFTDAMQRSKSIINFKLKENLQIQAQAKVFRYIEAYLETFDDLETKSQAAFNLALKTRNIANEVAELHFQMRGAE